MSTRGCARLLSLFAMVGAPAQRPDAHWAFVPPRRPEPPAVQLANWPRGAIDRFVLARLEAERLSPSPDADRRTLIRRVSLDLTGLPPTPAEVAAFVADPATDAYERVVDRLLASPRCAEHLARYWLDAARYGDTHGLHLDNYREMWPYRDRVVDAFREDLPYHEFAIEQLAGDLLPNATLAQRIASGFNRCHVTTNEGGSIEEEVHVRNVVDRVSTFGTVFLGLTLGCAACHDHKFDPISQRDFYALSAFFNNVDGKPMDDNAKAPGPVVRVPSAAQEARLAELRASAAALETEVAESIAAIDYTDPGHAEPPDDRPRTEHVWIDDELPPDAKIEGELVWVAAAEGPVHSGRRAMRRQSRGNQQHFFANAATKLRVGDGDCLFAWVWLDPQDPPRELMLQFNGDGGDGWRHRAFWGENLIGYGKDGTTERRRLGELPPAGQWVRLAVDARVVGLLPGMVVHGVAFTQFDGTSHWDSVGIETATPQHPVDVTWVDDSTPPGAVLKGDGRTWQWLGGDAHPIRSGSRSVWRGGSSGLNQDFFNGAPRLRLAHGDRLFAHVWLDPADPPRSVQLQFHDGSWNHRARWGEPAHGAGMAGGADFVAGPLPPLGRWVRLEIGLADVGLAPGARLDGLAFTQVDGSVYWDLAGVRTWAPPDERALDSLSAWERLARDDDALPSPVRESLAVEPDARSAAQQRVVRDHWLRFVWRGGRATFEPLERRLEDVRTRTRELEDAIPTTLVMRERAELTPAYVLRRGEYDRRGEQVARATPAFLPPMEEDLPRDRLGLARWLFDPRQSLTARVAVNRLWQQVFGTGLVKTSEDFGTQGERPSHPELLDWLATEFADGGYRTKALLRLLVTSATYRQASDTTPELLARDPDNRLLARGPRFRLDAEVLRDQALYVSGLLVERLGGPSVKPPQPPGLWEAVGYTSSNTARFVADQGPDHVHRRTLYTFVKRTATAPQLATFDAPNRESCVVRRERTNTPLQALLLLNDPQYVEAARALATRILREGGADDWTRAAWAFALVTCRPPADADLADVLALLATERERFARDAAAARALFAGGAPPADPVLDPVELAAWTIVANLLLNLDEVVTRS